MKKAYMAKIVEHEEAIIHINDEISSLEERRCSHEDALRKYVNLYNNWR